jgi:hypothetical protein
LKAAVLLKLEALGFSPHLRDGEGLIEMLPRLTWIKIVGAAMLVTMPVVAQSANTPSLTTRPSPSR